jgi:hypothetical protein
MPSMADEVATESDYGSFANIAIAQVQIRRR